MYEKHELEQYFYNDATITRLADFVADYPNPCCLCAPMVGRELVRRGISVRILDIDTRFADLPGFRHYDLYRPEWLGEEFGLIVCDPPFFNVSLSQLFTTLRLLARHDYRQPLLLSYLSRRAASITGTFSRFGVAATDCGPGYQTVQEAARNDIAFFGNLGDNAHQRLCEFMDSQDEKGNE